MEFCFVALCWRGESYRAIPFADTMDISPQHRHCGVVCQSCWINDVILSTASNSARFSGVLGLVFHRINPCRYDALG